MKNTKSGAVIVEFAIVLPVFLLLILGVIEIFWIMHNYQTINFAAKSGARILALYGNNINDSENHVMEILHDFNMKIPPFVIISNDPDPFCRKKHSFVSTRIEVPFNKIFITGNPFNIFDNNTKLKSSITMRKEC